MRPGRLTRPLHLLTVAALATALLWPQLSWAQRFCVYDPLGAQGDAYAAAKDFAIEAGRWNVSLELKPYTDDRIAMEDFIAGQCEMASMIGLRSRQFNQFTGSIDAVGAVENYNQLRSVLQLLTSPRIDKLMVSGKYEVAGIFPMGAGYAFVNDRSINTLAKATGKKIAVMDWDKSQAMLVQQIGAQPIAADVATFAPKFNNGSVDVVIAPIIAYKPLELYRGLGDKGAIARYPLIQLTMQMVIYHEKFPAGFGSKSRAYIYKQVDRALAVIRKEENAVPQKHWLYISRTEREGYTNIMRDARSRLAKDGFYDRRMLNLMKRVRCKAEPDEAECTAGDE